MDDSADLPVLAPEITFLREVALEGQELYGELRYVGFTERQATAIVARMITDAVHSRNEDDYAIVYMESDDEDDDDLEDDDYDDRDGS
jgi:hypothetical protein